MDVVINPDGSTIVTCEGSTITIKPKTGAIAGGDDGSLPNPGTISAFVRRDLGHFGGFDSFATSLRLSGDAPSDRSAGDDVLVLHVRERLDVARLRQAMQSAGLPSTMRIEIVPAPPRG